MNPKTPSAFEKSRQVKEHGMSRIDQLRQELAEKQEEAGITEEPIHDHDFIENDIGDLEDDAPHARKRINTSSRARVLVPKTSSQTESVLDPSQRQKMEDKSKAVLEDLIKEKIPDQVIDAGRIQQGFKNSSYSRHIQDKMRNNTPVQKESLTDKLLFSKFAPTASSDELRTEKRLDFFLLDAVEDIDNASIAYLFGKVFLNRKHINACVQVNNIQREVYVMPKKGFNAKQVEQEVKDLIAGNKSFNNAEVKFSRVTKRYCFEMDVDYRNEDVEVLQVNYSYRLPPLTLIGQVGNTFKGVFGLSTPPLEILTIMGNLNGPNWFKIENFEIVPQNTFSDQFLNIKVTDHTNSIRPLDAQLPSPPLTMITFQLRINPDTQDVEASYISCYSSFMIEDNSYAAVDHILLYSKSFVVKQEPKADRKNYVNILQESEHAHLNTIQTLLSKFNPDIIVGHELFSDVIDVYLTKLKNNGIESLNLLSRCCVDPKKLIRMNNKNVKNKAKITFAGRLLLDTFALSKEFLKLDEYSLSAIHASLNKETSSLINPTPEVELRTSAVQIEDIMLKLQLLPLTLQLSKVAGCLWQISLRQARAERNEVLLLHKFYTSNYIIPDKQKFEKDDEDEEKGYAGGLVLEPSPNFYDSYIVLVDFNSLYPSIIRHYKICFTTVIRQFKNLNKLTKTQQEEPTREEMVYEEQELVKPMTEINVIPDQDPLLPQILTILINKRKEVKNMMKREKNPSGLRQLDIKQQAYKLIANSIYGCLGFSYSRFYSKKMAALVTKFGRSLLESSKALIETQGYSVIYGDTDSLMVNTMKADLFEAILIGIELKKEINNQFKKERNSRDQILEVELDGVFKKLLLLKKKKYAALSVTNYMQIAQSQNAEVKEQLKLEIKGMDMIRRDWSKLTKDISHFVLNILMESGDLEEVYNYLSKVNYALNLIAQVKNPNDYDSSKLRELQIKFKAETEKVGNNRIQEEFVPEELPTLEIRDFIIKKQLNKKPTEYGDTTSQPHVRVALWMKTHFNKTDEQLVNHFIPFVITTRGSALGDKAMHIEQFYNQFNDQDANGSEKEIFGLDINWYKNNQLLNPVQRMLGAIEGHSEEKLKILFELKSILEAQDDQPEERKYSMWETFSTIYQQLPKIYRATPLDTEMFKSRCSLCKGMCYAFMPSCQMKLNLSYPTPTYINRVTAKLNSMVTSFYNFTEKCPDCKYSQSHPCTTESTCINHDGKKLKPVTSPTELIAKLLYFKQLCLHFQPPRENYKSKSTDVEEKFRKLIHEIGYESKGTLKAFEIYIQGTNDNRSHVKLQKLI
jgi:DNA polymerase alpha subunit A